MKVDQQFIQRLEQCLLNAKSDQAKSRLFYLTINLFNKTTSTTGKYDTEQTKQ